VVSVQADIRRPQAILEHRDVARLIDFGQPAGPGLDIELEHVTFLP
jgi:hypothetical protein